MVRSSKPMGMIVVMRAIYFCIRAVHNCSVVLFNRTSRGMSYAIFVLFFVSINYSLLCCYWSNDWKAQLEVINSVTCGLLICYISPLFTND